MFAATSARYLGLTLTATTGRPAGRPVVLQVFAG
jgi:hypothetical protein